MIPEFTRIFSRTNIKRFGSQDLRIAEGFLQQGSCVNGDCVDVLYPTENEGEYRVIVQNEAGNTPRINLSQLCTRAYRLANPGDNSSSLGVTVCVQTAAAESKGIKIIEEDGFHYIQFNSRDTNEVLRFKLVQTEEEALPSPTKTTEPLDIIVYIKEQTKVVDRDLIIPAVAIPTAILSTIVVTRFLLGRLRARSEERLDRTGSLPERSMRTRIALEQKREEPYKRPVSSDIRAAYSRKRAAEARRVGQIASRQYEEDLKRERILSPGEEMAINDTLAAKVQDPRPKKSVVRAFGSRPNDLGALLEVVGSYLNAAEYSPAREFAVRQLNEALQKKAALGWLGFQPALTVLRAQFGQILPSDQELKEEAKALSDQGFDPSLIVNSR